MIPYWIVYVEDGKTKAMETGGGLDYADYHGMCRELGLKILGQYNGGSENDAINYHDAINRG